MTPDQLLRATVARALSDKAACSKDPWEAIKRGWVFTLDEKPGPGVAAIRPLPAKPHLEVVTRLWQQSPRGILYKSRQVQMSWLFSWLELWDAIFNEGRHCIIQGKRLEDVDAKSPHNILGRARFIRQHLPIPICPKVINEVITENVTSETYANASTIEAIPEGAAIVRGKVPSSMFMDEGGFQETGEDNWNAANPSASKLWMVSTPNGHEFGYRQAEPGRPWDEWRQWPEIIPGVHSYRNSRGIQLVFVHYSADPDNRTVEAQTKRREGYTDEAAYLRENEGNFTLREGLPVFPEFRTTHHVIPEYKPDPGLPLYLGWDFGFTGQAVSFFQQNFIGQIIWFDQIILKGVALQRVIMEAKRRIMFWMGRPYEDPMSIEGLAPGRPVVTPAVFHYGDPSASAHNTRGETDLMLLSQFGIQLLTKTTTNRKRSLVDQVRTLLLPRNDGKPAILVARNGMEMNHVIAGFGGGYHFGPVKEGKAEKEVPHKDGFYDHIFDAAQYAIDHIAPIQYAQTADLESLADLQREVGVGHPDYN